METGRYCNGGHQWLIGQLPLLNVERRTIIQIMTANQQGYDSPGLDI